VLGVTIVVVALPSIAAQLQADAGEVQCVVSIYALVFGGFLMPAGRAADLYGRRLFMTGLALFVAASLACDLAGSVALSWRREPCRGWPPRSSSRPRCRC
jgi:MFS family permease